MVLRSPRTVCGNSPVAVVSALQSGELCAFQEEQHAVPICGIDVHFAPSRLPICFPVTEESSMKPNRLAFQIRPGMRQGLRSEVPLPTRLVSNEEFPPMPQTEQQREVESAFSPTAERLAPRLGMSRRQFLRTSGGMATSFLAMNAVFGRFFDVLRSRPPSRRPFQRAHGRSVLHLRRPAPLRRRRL